MRGIGLHRSRAMERLGDNGKEGVEFPPSKSLSRDSPLHELRSSAHFSQCNTVVVSELIVHYLDPKSLALEHSLIHSLYSFDKKACPMSQSHTCIGRTSMRSQSSLTLPLVPYLGFPLSNFQRCFLACKKKNDVRYIIEEPEK